MGIEKACPKQYRAAYGDSLVDSNQVPVFETKNVPNALKLAADEKKQYYLELEGDIQGNLFIVTSSKLLNR